MVVTFGRLSSSASIICILLLWPGVSSAQTPPGEVANVLLAGTGVLSWDAAATADDYNVYRGDLSVAGSQEGAVCHGDEIFGTLFTSPDDPPLGSGYYFLITAESNTAGEGTAGTATPGVRILRGSCDKVMRAHFLNRIGFGWDEWTRDRYASLGRQAYIDEQLAPETIDETSNTELAARTASILPPDSLNELLALDIVNAVYARRQLEHQAALFWDNHFNTDHRTSFQFFGFYQTLFPATRSLEAAKFHYSALNTLRDLAFNGTFREMVEASALTPAMILYLDTDSNVLGVPNENFARELLELHSLGVDGGYTQQDIVELARVFTGWNVCKKTDPDAGDPLAPCIPRQQYGTVSEPAGQWVNNFRVNLHDTGQKVLFAGTPHEAIIPSTSGNPQDGINDASLALDAIVAHPATARFISKKLLQRFVTESPSEAAIDSVVAEWNDGSNPRGVGDLREVVRAVLSHAEFLDPDAARGKIKTPFEHLVSALRAARGKTDGSSSVRSYLTRMSELFHQNPVPTGYSELGADWLDTNNLLERQNFGLDMTSRTASAFGADVIGLLAAHGISTAPVPDNSAAIVDFFAEVLFGGALTPAEKQKAITYLTTNDSQAVSAYNDARIRETHGFMMGFGQFLEQ